MKIKNVLVVGLLVMASSVFAQNEIGVKAGVNYTDVRIENNFPNSTSGNFGFDVGVYDRFHFVERFFLQTELLVSHRVTDYSFDAETPILIDPNDPVFAGDIDTKLTETLLVLPVMVGFDITNNLSLSVGPQLGYVLNRSMDDDVVDNSYFHDDYDAFDFSVNAGLDYEVVQQLRVGVSYSHGITERDAFKTNFFSLGLSYQLW